MTATIQVDYFTPDIFAKVEKRLAVAIHEQATALADAQKEYRDPLMHEVLKINSDFAGEKVRFLRGIHQALKRRLPVNLDAELYWSLTNE